MPTVPVVDQNPTNTPGFEAGGVAPMRNYAPDQIKEMGATLQQSGMREMAVGQSVALRIQEQMDDANVKAAEGKFIQSATDILHGDNGYMNKQGADAVSGYDNASQSLIKAKKDVMDSLGNDIQKRIFDRVTTQHLVTLGGQMSVHRAQQRIEYSATQSLSRADSMRAMAQNSDIGSKDQSTYIESGVQEIQNALKFKGVPADSEEAKKAERAFRSQITQDNVSRLMEDGKYKEAGDLLTEQMKAGNMEGDTGDRLRRAIRGNLQRTENIEQAEKIFAPYQQKDELRSDDLTEMLGKASKIENPEQREHVQDMVRAKYNEAHSMQAQAYRENLSDVSDYIAQNGSTKGIDPDLWGKIKPADQAAFLKPPAQTNDLNTMYNFIVNPSSLTVDNVKQAYAKGMIEKGTLLSLTQRAIELQNKPEYIQEASDIGGRISYFANQSGMNVYGMKDGSAAAQTPEDKANHGALTLAVQNEIDRVKAQSHGKITSDQVDQIIRKQLVQRAITKPGWIWDTKIQKYGFQIPAGATGTAKGTDGKLHWTDGKTDLGVAE